MSAGAHQPLEFTAPTQREVVIANGAIDALGAIDLALSERLWLKALHETPQARL